MSEFSVIPASHDGSRGIPADRFPDPGRPWANVSDTGPVRDFRQVAREMYESSGRVRAQREQEERDAAWNRRRMEMADEWERRQDEKLRQIQAGVFPSLRDGHWESHLMWLRQAFRDREFTTLAVRDAARDSATWAGPPRYASLLFANMPASIRVFFDVGAGEAAAFCDAGPDDKGFAIRLGQAYAKIAGELIGGWLWLTPGGVTHNRRRWQVSAKAAYPASG